ncbi:hypothetical protein [Carnimonas nigrificans]|nr:hypothetical protein [Carnimonas nigrificans]
MKVRISDNTPQQVAQKAVRLIHCEMGLAYFKASRHLSTRPLDRS